MQMHWVNSHVGNTGSHGYISSTARAENSCASPALCSTASSGVSVQLAQVFQYS